MKLIIDIPEEEYKLVRHGNKSYTTELELMNAVANGKLLPEHHGRLIDADALWKKWVFDAIGKQAIDEAPTIIEGTDSEQMTNKEAIDILRSKMDGHTDTSYEWGETVRMAINALEKDTAKEPVQTHKRYGHGNEYDDYYCPECDEFLAYEPQGNGYKQEGGWSRCKNCGQKIKWELQQEVKQNDE